MSKKILIALIAISIVGLQASKARATIGVTGFGPGLWGASDAALGVSGFTIERFESTTLAPGLLVGWQSPLGNVTPASTLPGLFDPLTDPFGNVFSSPQSGIWDGVFGVLNTRDNQSHSYAAVGNWGDIIFQFTTPVRSVGFSVEQLDLEARLLVNGVDIGGMASLAGFSLNGLRQGYLRIDASNGETITSVRINNGRTSFNDGFLIDHFAFDPVPEPTGLVLLGGFLGLLVYRRR